ncbi:MAG: element excision factor XisH family protein [Cyanobacteria bacterium J06636_28]
MSAKDAFHPVVKRALQNDGWLITHDPFAIKVGTVDMAIDLGAERLVAAERNGEKIAVEIKSFLASASAISEFHTALGQFINYRGALKRKEPNRTLYLAVPNRIFESFFQLEFPQAIIEENQVKLIVYDVQQEVIVSWTS